MCFQNARVTQDTVVLTAHTRERFENAHISQHTQNNTPQKTLCTPTTHHTTTTCTTQSQQAPYSKKKHISTRKNPSVHDTRKNFCVQLVHPPVFHHGGLGKADVWFGLVGVSHDVHGAAMCFLKTFSMMKTRRDHRKKDVGNWRKQKKRRLREKREILAPTQTAPNPERRHPDRPHLDRSHFFLAAPTRTAVTQTTSTRTAPSRTARHRDRSPTRHQTTRRPTRRAHEMNAQGFF